MAGAESLSPEERREQSRLGGIRSQSAEVLAAKIARDWPELTAEQKTVVRVLLRPVLRERAPHAKKAS